MINLLQSVAIAAAIAPVASQVVDGGWSEWEQTGPCCDLRRFMSRSCTNPAPENGGAYCQGPNILSFTCPVNDCPNDGFSDWSEFGPCCFGSQTRSRECLKASGECEGEVMETMECESENEECYQPNFEKGKCDVTDSDMVALKEDLVYEMPTDCCDAHFVSTVEACLLNSQPPVDGGWTEWSEYNECCQGKQTRFRTCTNPVPAFGGVSCDGSFSQLRDCEGEGEEGCDSQVRGEGTPEGSSGTIPLESMVTTLTSVAVLFL